VVTKRFEIWSHLFAEILILKIKTGRDEKIALEVERLKMAKVDGIVLVRDDGGGSLSTVVDIAGLFIEQDCVQIKSAGKKKKVLYDRDKKLSGMVH
jgi:carboxyl-terminal processing protease